MPLHARIAYRTQSNILQHKFPSNIHKKRKWSYIYANAFNTEHVPPQSASVCKHVRTNAIKIIIMCTVLPTAGPHAQPHKHGARPMSSKSPTGRPTSLGRLCVRVWCSSTIIMYSMPFYVRRHASMLSCTLHCAGLERTPRSVSGELASDDGGGGEVRYFRDGFLPGEHVYGTRSCRCCGHRVASR